jgi:hypothetical protein
MMRRHATLLGAESTSLTNVAPPGHVASRVITGTTSETASMRTLELLHLLAHG